MPSRVLGFPLSRHGQRSAKPGQWHSVDRCAVGGFWLLRTFPQIPASVPPHLGKWRRERLPEVCFGGAEWAVQSRNDFLVGAIVASLRPPHQAVGASRRTVRLSVVNSSGVVEVGGLSGDSQPRKNSSKTRRTAPT